MVSIHAPLVKDRGCYFVRVDVDYGLRSRNACFTLAKAIRLVEARIEGNGQWAMGNGQWAMGNGQWAMGNEQWAMGNGQGMEAGGGAKEVLGI